MDMCSFQGLGQDNKGVYIVDGLSVSMFALFPQVAYIVLLDQRTTDPLR